MKWVRWFWLLALVAVVGCADGGPVGTGIASSSISGNVAAVDSTSTGSAAALSEPVHVNLVEFPSIEDTTDAAGNFALVGDFSGPVTVRFMAGRVSALTETIDVPQGADVVLDDVEVRADAVQFAKPQVRRFLGRVALVDCAADVPGAAEILADDRRPTTTNQFLIRLSADTVIIRGDGTVLQCGQIKNSDPIGIEGIIRPDRTIDAIAVVVMPPAPSEPQPVLEVHFRGQVNVANCTSGNLDIDDAIVGSLRLKLAAGSVLVDANQQPVACRALQSGSLVDGRGLKTGKLAGIAVVRMVVKPPPS